MRDGWGVVRVVAAIAAFVVVAGCTTSGPGGGHTGGSGGSSETTVTVRGESLGFAGPSGSSVAVHPADLGTLPAVPADRVLPFGALDVQVSDVAVGSVATIVVTLDVPATGVLKLIDGRWDPFKFNESTGTGAVVSDDGRTITLKIRDGGPGDRDGTANGHVSDPVAPTGVQVETGAFACAVVIGGHVKCWGGRFSPPPALVEGIEDAVQVSVAWSACALLGDGTVKCWVPTLDGSPPVLVPVALSGPAVDVSVGGAPSDFPYEVEQAGYGCAALVDGTVQCWGDNHGQLGTTELSVAPLSAPVNAGVTGATAVTASQNGHVCALVTGGGIRCWGDNTQAQFGDGLRDDNCCSGAAHVTVAPIGRPDEGTIDPTGLPPLTGATGVSAGDGHSCAVVAGRVLCWGSNFDGQLGFPAFNPTVINQADNFIGLSVVPADNGVSDAMQVSAGQDHSCALLTNGKVLCWGQDDSPYGTDGAGGLGDGPADTTFTGVPVEVSGITSAVSISASASYSCAALLDGSIWCWGWNFEGWLGSDPNLGVSESDVPVMIP